MKKFNKELLWSPWLTMIIVGVVYIIKFGLKMGIGQWVNSPALIADAFHNLSDLVEVGLVMFFGIYLASKPKSAEYPMGRKRIESILVLGVGLALMVLVYATVTKSISGLISLWPALDNLIRPNVEEWLLPKIEQTMISSGAFFGVLLATGLSTIMSMFIGRYQIKVGKKAGMTSIIADGHETLSDGRIELATFIGFIIKFGLIYSIGEILPQATPVIGGLIEYGLGLFVAFLVFKTSKELTNNALGVLLARSIDKNLVDEIKNIINKIAGVRSIKDLTTFSDGHTATCLVTIETVHSSLSYRPVRRTIKSKVTQFLKNQNLFIGQEVHVNFKRPETTLSREVQAILVDENHNEITAPTIRMATHLRIYDLDEEQNRLRAVDVSLLNKELTEILEILDYKVTKRIYVFIGDDEERRSVEQLGIDYITSPMMRVYVPSQIRQAEF